MPLTPVDGNRRPKSGRAKPSRKEKENMAQAQEGITISDAESVDIMDTSGSAEKIVQTRGKDAGQLQWLVEYLEGKFASMQQKLEQRNKELAQQNTDMKQTINQLQQRVETMEIMIYEAREQRVTGLGPLTATQQQGQRSYAGAVLHGATTAGNPTKFLAPRADEFFCTIDFSRTEGGEKAVNIPERREKIEKEAQKGENKTFKCKGIVRDHRTQCQGRILCRSEEGLDGVKRAATEIATEGVRILRDQLYPVKVNNVRADAVLQPNGNIKEDIVSALNDRN